MRRSAVVNQVDLFSFIESAGAADPIPEPAPAFVTAPIVAPPPALDRPHRRPGEISPASAANAREIARIAMLGSDPNERLRDNYLREAELIEAALERGDYKPGESIYDRRRPAGETQVNILGFSGDLFKARDEAYQRLARERARQAREYLQTPAAFTNNPLMRLIPVSARGGHKRDRCKRGGRRHVRRGARLLSRTDRRGGACLA